MFPVATFIHKHISKTALEKPDDPEIVTQFTNVRFVMERLGANARQHNARVNAAFHDRARGSARATSWAPSGTGPLKLLK